MSSSPRNRVRSLSEDRADQPPLPVVAVSRLVDAPRRIWSYL